MTRLVMWQETKDGSGGSHSFSHAVWRPWHHQSVNKTPKRRSKCLTMFQSLTTRGENFLPLRWIGSPVTIYIHGPVQLVGQPTLTSKYIYAVGPRCYTKYIVKLCVSVILMQAYTNWYLGIGDGGGTKNMSWMFKTVLSLLCAFPSIEYHKGLENPLFIYSEATIIPVSLAISNKISLYIVYPFKILCLSNHFS